MQRTHNSCDGFTLVEVVIAMFILAGILLLMSPAAMKSVSTSAKSRRDVQAAAVADARIAEVRASPVYDSLSVRFNGSTSNVPFTGWSRATQVVRSGAGTTADLTRVTVTVTGPGLAQPIKRSTTVAAP